MSLPSLSIRRPVLATVFSLVICLFGLLAITRLGVREFPSVDPPIITVRTAYSGASSEVIDAQITEPLEASINAAAGIRTMTSVSREGISNITVEFDLDTDLEAAANDVRDRAAQSSRNLPPDADPPIISKADADRSPVVMVTVRSDKRDLLGVSEFADRVLKERFQTIPGVAEASIWGEKEYAMRIYFDRLKLAAYGLTLDDVRNAITIENVELPSGRVEGDSAELEVKTRSRLNTAEEFNNIVIKEDDGRVVRLRDVGRAELGALASRSIFKRYNAPMVAVVLRPQPGANQIAIVDEFSKRLAEIERNLPEDIQIDPGFDMTIFIRNSLKEVAQSIAIAILLVVLIIYLFLRDWRATLIPSIAIPISLLGGCFVMFLAGFSINTLTLLAMVLAIGLVVDDSIVVLENIYAKVESGMRGTQAGIAGTREIFFAVIATTLALIAVFLPILFLSGLSGRLFREFGVVLGATVAISSFVALTLAPMLCAKLLGGGGGHSKFYHKTEPFFQGMTKSYRRLLVLFLKVRWLAFPVLIATAAGCWLLLKVLPSELAPLEDRSSLRINVIGPEGAGFSYMDEYMDRLNAAVTEATPEAASIVVYTSPSFGASGGSNSGFARITLVEPDERNRSQKQITSVLRKVAAQIPGARTVVNQEQSLSTRPTLPVEFVLQGPNQKRLEEMLPEFLAAAEASPVFSRVDVDLRLNKPDLRVEIDRDRARLLGVSTEAIAQTLSFALSEQRLGFFNRDGRQHQVIAQLNDDDRRSIADLNQIQVRGANDALIRLNQVVKIEEGTASPQLLRFNRFPSATVSADLNDGYRLGDGLTEMERIASEVLGDEFRTDLAGTSRDFRESSGTLAFVFVLALALIYLVLAAQFESFRDPFVIMLTVPLAAIGALGGLFFFGQTLNIFSQIGMIMLIGLVTKNGILIVEFANQRKAEGLSVIEAALEASCARLRPVLMTAFSTILGILPIALALGAGSQSRMPMGIAVVCGMTLGTLLTLFVIPSVYCFFTSRTPSKPAATAEPEPALQA